MLVKLTGGDALVRWQGLVAGLTLDPEDRFGRVVLCEVAAATAAGPGMILALT